MRFFPPSTPAGSLEGKKSGGWKFLFSAGRGVTPSNAHKEKEFVHPSNARSCAAGRPEEGARTPRTAQLSQLRNKAGKGTQEACCCSPPPGRKSLIITILLGRVSFCGQIPLPVF